MGFSFSYETTEPISPLLQQEIVAASDQLLSGRTWLSCEPPHLTNDGGRLRGNSKPNMMAHPDDVTSAQTESRPDGTVRDLLEILVVLSGRFDIDWEIAHDHSDGPLGYIRNGICDDVVREQCEAFSDLTQDLLDEDVDFPE